ncbi:MAG TPA: sialate O-acetylesterase [Bacteroidales bacterium]|nr:sialate O-acetylesterase [Bacteroidales bacterium]
MANTKKMHPLAWLMLFMLCMNVGAQNPNFYIYLCFGQSNMEGQGTIETQDKTVDSRFKVFQALNCSNLGRTKAKWYTAVPPTCQCYSKLSPADYFGRTMVANLPDSITVGIINVAVGGCDIRLFDKDIYMDYDSTYKESWFTSKVKDYGYNPYKYLIDLAKLAQQDGVIKGILLHQGETNTGDAQWPTYVKKIYNDMLADLSLKADSVPILAGEVLAAAGNCCSSMNSIIKRLPDTIPTAHVISSAGCAGQDYAHFNSEGYRKLGRRYGATMLSLMGLEAAYAEAECGTVGKNWKTLADKNASNGAYVTQTAAQNNTASAPSSEDNIIQMSISVSADTSYYLYGRFNNASANSNAFWVKVDDAEFELFDNLTTTGWQWLELKKLDLTAGEHKIYVGFAKDSAMLDKICLKNAQKLPVDVAEEAANLCTPSITPDPTQVGVTAKDGYALYQNFPNPVNNCSTIITFHIPQTSFVSLKVYNSQGLEIKELAGRTFTSGEHNITFNIEKLSPGAYFYTLRAGQFSSTQKMIIPVE